MAAGLPISLMHVPEYHTRSRAVQEIYATLDAGRARRLALQLGIDFLYVDGTDRARTRPWPSSTAAPTGRPVYRNREVTVYATR